jgi:hypothetical protein
VKYHAALAFPVDAKQVILLDDVKVRLVPPDIDTLAGHVAPVANVVVCACAKGVASVSSSAARSQRIKFTVM